jgi:hypothetical protein
VFSAGNNAFVIDGYSESIIPDGLSFDPYGCTITLNGATLTFAGTLGGTIRPDITANGVGGTLLLSK